MWREHDSAGCVRHDVNGVRKNTDRGKGALALEMSAPAKAGGSGCGRDEWPLEPSGYELRDEVGISKHGVVRRAYCPGCQKEVAIKVVNLDTLVGEGEVDRLHAQTTLLSSMSDEHVIQYHCSFVSKQELWIVMEYAAHGSCQLVMTGDDGAVQPLAEGHIAAILSSVTRGIAYLHAREHAHRDIKAANIMVHEDGRATIGDFASSRSMFATGDRKELQTFVGTAHWMAPEVWEQSGRYDLQADIWSLGITAIELATGAVPLEGDPPLKVMRERLDPDADPPTLPLGGPFSADFREFVSICLQRDPTARPTAAQLLEHPYFQRATSTAEIVDTVLCRLGPLEKRYAAASSRPGPAGVQGSGKVSGRLQRLKSLEEKLERVPPRFSFSFGDSDEEEATEADAAPGISSSGSGHGAAINMPQKMVQFGEPAQTRPDSLDDLFSFAEATAPSGPTKAHEVLIPDSNGVVINSVATVEASTAPAVDVMSVPTSPLAIGGTALGLNTETGYVGSTGAVGAAASAAAAAGTAHAAYGAPVIVGVADSTSALPAGSGEETDDLIQFDSPKVPLSPIAVLPTSLATPRRAADKRFLVTPLEEPVGAATAVATVETMAPDRMAPVLVSAPAPVPLTQSSPSTSTASSIGAEKPTVHTMSTMAAVSPGPSAMDPRQATAGSGSAAVDMRQTEPSAAVSPATSPPSHGQNAALRAAPPQQPVQPQLVQSGSQPQMVKSGSRFSMTSLSPTSSAEELEASAGGGGGATHAQRAGSGLAQDTVQPLAIADEEKLEFLLRQLQQRVLSSMPTERKLQDDLDLATRKIKEAMELTRPRG